MQKSDIEKLRSLPSEGVAQRLGFTVKHHKTLCPFHNDHTPSLTFKKNKFRCWSCGESGDSISFVEKVLGKDFLDACRWLADENNVILTEYKPEEVKPVEPFDTSRYERYFERPCLNKEARRFLFEERRLDPRVVRWCRLTSWRDKQGVSWLQTPYYDSDGKLVGVPAVIDKDFASAKLAELVDADELVILTAIDRVMINYGKPNQKAVESMTCAEAQQYIEEGHFAPGSMLPKVQAAMSFAKTGKEAIIASLENAARALQGESGTKVTP